MQRIIAGRFQSKNRAGAVVPLLERYMARTGICIFHNNPAGQHDASISGGDENAGSGAGKR